MRSQFWAIVATLRTPLQKTQASMVIERIACAIGG